MDRRSWLRACASLAGTLAFASMTGFATGAASCSPLQLDFAIGDASGVEAEPSPDASDATVGHDALLHDASPSLDADSAVLDSATPSGDADAAQGIPCSTGTDCASDSATPLCNADAGMCVQCLSPADCTGRNTPHCINGVCGACSVNADCNEGGADGSIEGGMEGGMVCNTWIPRCASSCMSGFVCTQQGLVCSMVNGYCVECVDDTYCVTKTTGKHCYVPAGVCGCQTNADCPNPQMPNCGPPSPTGNRFCGQ